MKKSSNDQLRQEIIGLGKNSIRKNYYRSLLEKQQALEDKNKELELEIQKRKKTEDELKHLNEALETKIADRTEDLRISNQKLQRSLNDLEKSYAYLIEAEKMASLSHLVRGISHELNTPLGVSLTTASYASDIIKSLLDKGTQLTYSDFNTQLSKINESIDIILEGITKSAELTRSFKEIASIHGKHEKSKFHVKDYLDTIIKSMHNDFSKFDHVEINLYPHDNIIINGYPGIFTQVLTILITNSLNHGFSSKGGVIDLYFKEDDQYNFFTYKDNGKGIDEGDLTHLFEPFFTTKMSGTNPGLGLFTAYNLIKSIQGDINCYNNKGFCVVIKTRK